MGRRVAIGLQDFGDLIQKGYFYVDKTDFIREWWEGGDSVTLITRPRRFGKTLNMSMLQQFFSLDYEGRGDLFEGLSIWQDEKYRVLQGTYPVISLSFANIKESCYKNALQKISLMLSDLYASHYFLLDSPKLTEADKDIFRRVNPDMDEVTATMAIHYLSKFLYLHYGKKVIILLDEYDTPMQEAYVHGFWDEIVAFTRSLFNAAFKTNPWLERAVMTGITRVSKESIFSDLNNLRVVTTTSPRYETAFGFTEEEVFAALDECGRGDQKEKVKRWYDGFTFGNHPDIYNPWSILNFLDTGLYDTYWANTSGNGLVSKLIWEGNGSIKEKFETLLKGGVIHAEIDEQIVYNQLDGNEEAVWSLLLASGYLKAVSHEILCGDEDLQGVSYELALTNTEVRRMFYGMVQRWFSRASSEYNYFIKALLQDDIDAMNAYMNRVALSTISYFDSGKNPSPQEPERFYHGFTLGMMLDLQDRYVITSNRESGYGRYDVMLEPKNPAQDDAIIMEFKVHNPRKEGSLEDTAAAAIKQIRDKEYAASLISRGIPEAKIRSYGLAFEGKTVLIEKG